MCVNEYQQRPGRLLSGILVVAAVLAATSPPVSAQVASVQPVAARATEVDRSIVAQLSKEKLADADTILGFAAEGATLYRSEPVKLTGYQYCSQAISLADSGEFRQSLRAASKALHLAIDTGDDDLRAVSNRDLAIVMSYSGDLDKAELFAREALKYKASDPPIVAGPANKVIADVKARRHQYPEAIAAYEVAATASSDRFRPLVLASMANTLIDAGDVKRARSVLDTVQLTDGNPALAAQLDRTRARLLLAEGNAPGALDAYRKLTQQQSGFDSAYQRMWALEGVANAQEALGDKRAAAESLTLALNSLDTVRAQFRSEEVKLGLFSDLQELFERAIGLYIDLGDGARALEISEKSRARAFLDAVRGRAPMSQAALTTVGTTQVQALLAPNEVLLEFHALPDRLALWVVTHDGVQLRVVPLSRDQLATKVANFRQSITDGRGAAIAQADELGALLIDPIALKGGERLIVVPNGPLHYLPFQALRSNKAYLIETHRIATVPSMSIGAQLIARGSTSKAKLVAFGNPSIGPAYELPGARREVTELVTVFDGATSFMGVEATKTRFKSVAAASPMLHVAAHAEADLVDPLHSRILLANENGEQSFLEANEVLGLDLSRVSLVTLSACESALGRIASGDEVLGFPRSFLSAGADSMIASLWPAADDATFRLMTTTYQQLRRGDDLQTALQAGQLAVLRRPESSHPFFWAPFNLIGNWRLTFEP